MSDPDYNDLCPLCGEIKSKGDPVCEECDNVVIRTVWREDLGIFESILNSGKVVKYNGYPK